MNALELMQSYAERIGLQDEDVKYFEECMKLYAIELLKEHNRTTEECGGEMWYAEESAQWIQNKIKELNSTTYIP